MLSETTDVKRGEGLLMSGSLASRTAAMIDAAITSVEANLSVMRFCSAIALVRSCSSRAMARLISTMHHRRSMTREGFANRSCESRPWKMSAVNSGASPHKVGNRQLSRSPAWSRLVPGCSAGSPCRLRQRDKRRALGYGTWTQYRRI